MITAAALIMVFVFGSFVLNGDPTMKQFGIGLAVAVILDATVVRCLLVPALMVLMGKSTVHAGLAGPPRAEDQHRGRGFFDQRDRRDTAEPETELQPVARAFDHDQGDVRSQQISTAESF